MKGFAVVVVAKEKKALNNMCLCNMWGEKEKECTRVCLCLCIARKKKKREGKKKSEKRQ